MRDLILVRGVPGAGKSTLAAKISGWNVSADEYFDRFNDGGFDPTILRHAHLWCQRVCAGFMMHEVDLIAVHNTFTRKREMNKYFEMAEDFDYKVTTIIVENHHGSSSIHGVPDAKIQEMKDRFDIVL